MDHRRRSVAFGFLTALAITAGCTTSPPGGRGAARPDTALMRADVRYLASDALEGRGTGTPGNDSAATYLARRYLALGIEPLGFGLNVTPAGDDVTPTRASNHPCRPRDTSHPECL